MSGRAVMEGENSIETGELSGVPTILVDRCTGCTQCLLLCPVGAIARRGVRCLILDQACIRCGRCLFACPNEAVVEGHGSTPSTTGMDPSPRSL